MAKKKTCVERIVQRIEDDLNDRKGLHLSNLPTAIRKDIAAGWRKIIQEEIAPLVRVQMAATACMKDNGEGDIPTDVLQDELESAIEQAVL